MAPPFSMSRLWDHVSIPVKVDGFVIPSPCFVSGTSSFSLSLFSLSLSPSLSLFSFFSPPISTVSLEIFLSCSLLSLSQSFREKSLLPLSRSFSLLLFFLSLSFSSSLSSSPAHLSLSLSLSFSFFVGEISFSLFSLFFGNHFLLSPSLPSLVLPFSRSPTFFSLSLSRDESFPIARLAATFLSTSFFILSLGHHQQRVTEVESRRDRPTQALEIEHQIIDVVEEDI